MQDHQNFVPLAERPYATYNEVVEHERDTIWKNPTDQDVVLDLHVGTSPSPVFSGDKRIRGNLSWEERHGIRRYVIKKGEERALPKEFDKAVQDVRNGVIVGGLGPQLIRVGAQVRPKLHPALDDGLAQKKALMAEAAQALDEKKRQEEALVIAQGKLAQLQAQLEAAQAAKSAAVVPEAEATAPKRGGKTPI